MKCDCGFEFTGAANRYTGFKDGNGVWQTICSNCGAHIASEVLNENIVSEGKGKEATDVGG